MYGHSCLQKHEVVGWSESTPFVCSRKLEDTQTEFVCEDRSEFLRIGIVLTWSLTPDPAQSRGPVDSRGPEWALQQVTRSCSGQQWAPLAAGCLESALCLPLGAAQHCLLPALVPLCLGLLAWLGLSGGPTGWSWC